MSAARSIRPPSVPLVTHDPYFSIWSGHDRLTDGSTTHWSGRNHALGGLARIDGVTWRFCGAEGSTVPAMTQRRLELTATATRYEFTAGGVCLEVRFLSPLLCDDLELLSRPVTYLTLAVHSEDGRMHEVELYLDASAEIAVDHWDQPVSWSRFQLGGLATVRVGSSEQRPLGRAGDDLRIDWGWLYLALAATEQGWLGMGARQLLREDFAAGAPERSDDLDMPRRACDRHPTLCARFRLGAVGAAAQQRTLLLAYDDLVSVEYRHRRLPAYWRDHGRTSVDVMLHRAVDQHQAIVQRCRDFDQRFAEACETCLDSGLTANLTVPQGTNASVEDGGSAGSDFADLAVLSYRQCLAAHKLVQDVDGEPYLLSKENFSNGCIATVDVTFPSAPLFLLFNPALVRAMLEPVLRYAATSAWRFPFAPHDLGTYPLANGQVYGGGETSERDQMPIEECGNILILCAALAKAEGTPAFAARHWPLLETWASYVYDQGFDPPNQLCTDDFAGHLAGNCNLSVKAILGLGCFARLCSLRGRIDDAERWRGAAAGMASRWERLAADGGHTRLAFSQPGSWSQKYTLIWDQVLELRLFSPSVAAAETAWYRSRMQPFGLPLDGRHAYTTIDHVIWSACLGEDPGFLAQALAACRAYAATTPDRVPLCDWYDTITARKVGFQARSPVGGVLMPLMRNAAVWMAWRQATSRSPHAASPGLGS